MNETPPTCREDLLLVVKVVGQLDPFHLNEVVLDKYRLAEKKRPTIRLEDKRKDGNGFEWSGEEMYADVVGSRQSETLQRVDKLDKSLSFAPSVFLRKMPKPITQTQNVMKKLGQTQKGQKRQKMFGCLVHRKFGRIDLIPRNEKRLFGSSLLFLFYIFAWLCLLYKEKKTHWYKTQTQRDRPKGARAFRLGGARIPSSPLVFERI